MSSRHCLLTNHIYQYFSQCDVTKSSPKVCEIVAVSVLQCVFFGLLDISILLKMTEMSPQDTLLNNKFSLIEDVFVRTFHSSLVFYLSASNCFFKIRCELLHVHVQHCSNNTEKNMPETNICTYSSFLFMFVKHMRKKSRETTCSSENLYHSLTSFCKATHTHMYLHSGIFCVCCLPFNMFGHSNKILLFS